MCIAKGFQKAPDVCNNPACDILPLLSLFFFLYPLPLLLVVFLLLPLLPLSLAPDLRSHSPANTHPWSPHTNTDSHFLDHVKVTTCTASSTRWAHERDITNNDRQPHKHRHQQTWFPTALLICLLLLQGTDGMDFKPTRWPRSPCRGDEAHRLQRSTRRLLQVGNSVCALCLVLGWFGSSAQN